MCRTGGIESGHLQPEYAHELYSPEAMLATQSHGSAFLQLGAQPVQTHSFHGFLKQESEPSSDESTFGEQHGVIRKGSFWIS
jgi:hypothetical protein